MSFESSSLLFDTRKMSAVFALSVFFPFLMYFSTCWVFGHSSLTAAPSPNRRKLKMSYWSESQPNISSSPPQLPEHLIPKQAAIRLGTKWAKFPINSNLRVKLLSFCSENVAGGGCSLCCLSNIGSGLSGSLCWCIYWLYVTAFEERQINADC